MPGDLLERRGKIRSANCIIGHFEIHAVRMLRMVEEPTDVISAILKGHVWHSSLTKRNSPRDNTVFDDGRHGRPWRDRHLDVRTRGEDRCSHPIPIHLILKQDPLAHASLAVIMAGPEPGVVS